MLKIGWSKRDVSTKKPFPLAGQAYVRFVKFLLDPIFVTALTLDSGEDYVVFLSADEESLEPDVLREIRKRVKKENPEIDPLKILMNVTHCHTAPMLYREDGMGEYGAFSDFPHDGVDLIRPGEYFDFFIDRCVQAVCESYASRREGAVSYGYGFAVASHNRRAVYCKDMTEGSNDPTAKFIEGTTRMYGTTAIPEFSGLESGADPYANFLFTFDTKGKLTCSQSAVLRQGGKAAFSLKIRERHSAARTCQSGRSLPPPRYCGTDPRCV